MVKIDKNFSIFLAKKYPKEYILISFGHLECLTGEMISEYLQYTNDREQSQ